MKAVLDTSPGSAYDDEIASRYHFPSRYLDILKECVGDWVVFRQPRAGGGTKAYFATGRIDRIDPDPSLKSHFYAAISEYLPFARPVPWRVDGRYAEAALRDIENVAQVGVLLRGRSVRSLSDDDFSAIIAAGVTSSQSVETLVDHMIEPTVRSIVQALVNRKVRDANFRDLICNAYHGACAITGWRVADRKGNWEAQAAHIWSVSDGGPDTISNGLALTGTAHWLFDRHLVSITNDYRLIVSAKIGPELLSLFLGRDFRLALPAAEVDRPHQAYLARHRELFETRVPERDRVGPGVG